MLFPFQGPLGPSSCSSAGVPQWAGVPLAAGFPGRSGDEACGLDLDVLALPHALLPAQLCPVARVTSSMLISPAWAPVLPGWGGMSPACQEWRRGRDHSSEPVLRPLEGRPGLPFRACPTWRECGAGLPAHLRREPPICPSLFLRVHLCPAPPPTSSLPVSSLSPRCFSGRSGAVVSGHVSLEAADGSRMHLPDEILPASCPVTPLESCDQELNIS